MLDQDDKDFLNFMTHVFIRVLLVLFGLIFLFSLFAAWHDRNWPVPKVYKIEIIQKQGAEPLDQQQLDHLADSITNAIQTQESAK